MSDWLDTIKKLAPTVASAFLGPLGPVVAIAVGAILGVDSPTPEKINDAIKSGQLTPEVIGKLKELEMQYKNDEEVRGFKYSELEFQDTIDARARDIELRKLADGYNKRADIMLALTYLGIVALVVLMVFRDIDANSALGGIVILLIGKLISQWETGFMFEFGTTRSGKGKDQSILNLSKTANH